MFCKHALLAVLYRPRALQACVAYLALSTRGRQRRPTQGLFCWFVILALPRPLISSPSSSSFVFSSLSPASAFRALVPSIPCLGLGSKLKWSRSLVPVVHKIRPDSMYRVGPVSSGPGRLHGYGHLRLKFYCWYSMGPLSCFRYTHILSSSSLPRLLHGSVAGAPTLASPVDAIKSLPILISILKRRIVSGSR